MKKRIWAMVLCTAVFISGCGVRNNQAERIKALIGKVASESAAEENQKQENEEGNGGEQNEVQGENVNEIFAEGQEESLAGKEEGLDGKEESLAGQENHSVQAEESTNKGMSGEVNEKEEKDKQTEEEIAYRRSWAKFYGGSRSALSRMIRMGLVRLPIRERRVMYWLHIWGIRRLPSTIMHLV